MRYAKARWSLPVLVAGLLIFAPGWHHQPPEVDVALVLAVDVSTSMDLDEQDLQRRAYVEAFRSPLIHRAIRNGMHGRIAVAYIEWAGAHNPRYQSTVILWTILETSNDATQFAHRLEQAPIHRADGTSISAAIDFSMALFAFGDFIAARRVIDISGDGSNNQGRLVTEARDEAIARGITINGLPIMLKEPHWRENATLDAYYRDCVIGGPGAFMIPVRERQQFLTETRAKIGREIAGIDGREMLVQPVRGFGLTDCDTSESLWDDVAPEPHPSMVGAGQEL